MEKVFLFVCFSTCLILLHFCLALLVHCAQGGREPKPRGFVQCGSLGHQVVPGLSPCTGMTCSPHSGSDDLFIQLWLSQTTPQFNEVWVWFQKTSGCAPEQMKRVAHLSPSARVLGGLALLFPLPSAFPPWRCHWPWCRLPACFTDLAGVQN